MGNVYNASTYKNKIINLLMQNKDLVTLINPTPSDCDEIDISDVLLGGEFFINGKKYTEQGHIFDFDFVDEAITEDKTFIFVESSIDRIDKETFTYFSLFICVFTAKPLVRLNDRSMPSVSKVKKMGYNVGNTGNRIDILCDIIERTLNGSNKLKSLGEIKPAERGYIAPYRPSNKYYGKCMTFTVKNYNETEVECG